MVNEQISKVLWKSEDGTRAEDPSDCVQVTTRSIYPGPENASTRDRDRSLPYVGCLGTSPPCHSPL